MSTEAVHSLEHAKGQHRTLSHVASSVAKPPAAVRMHFISPQQCMHVPLLNSPLHASSCAFASLHMFAHLVSQHGQLMMCNCSSLGAYAICPWPGTPFTCMHACAHICCLSTDSSCCAIDSLRACAIRLGLGHLMRACMHVGCRVIRDLSCS